MKEDVKHLGKFKGMCACYNKQTLNGRPYDLIYKNILAGEDYRFNEMMRRGGILCEFGHPAQYAADFERTETDPEKAVALITNIKESKQGIIEAEGIILDTPAGRVYQAIAPFYKFGFSSRGSYEADPDSTEGPNGWNQSSYVFKGFDIVPLPANEGSEVVATESMKGNKRSSTRLMLKSAREALDINQIADATNVDPKEIEAELDKLFERDGSIGPVELVDAREFTEGKSGLTEPAEQSNILLDLHKVLTDKNELEKQVQKLLFQKAESDAALVSLQEQVAQLTSIKEKAEKQIDFYEENKEEIEALLDKLLETHKGALDAADVEIAEEKEKSKSLAAQVTDLKRDAIASKDEFTEQLDTATEKLSAARRDIQRLNSSLTAEQLKTKKATEELVAERSTSSKLKESAIYYRNECNAAVESLLDTYSLLYSVDKQLLQTKAGKKLTVAAIKRAAEGISNDTLRLSAYATAPVASKKESAPEPRYKVGDDIDAELFAALAEDNRLGDIK